MHISTTSSEPSAVPFAEPQGSVLGPILFFLYTADLLQLISRHLLHPHALTGDTDIYGFCKPSTTDILCQSMSACVNDASRWLKSNRLLLNPAKTEILWCFSPRTGTSSRLSRLVSATRLFCRSQLSGPGGLRQRPRQYEEPHHRDGSFMFRCVAADTQCSSISSSKHLVNPDSCPFGQQD